MSQSILEAFQEANNAIDTKKLIFAEIQELQSFQDSFKAEEYPINVIIPFTSNGTTNRDVGIRKAILPLQGWIVTRIKEDPANYRSAKMEELYIAPMRKLAQQFIKALLQTEIVNPEVNPITDTIRPEYMFLNQQVMGVSYTMNLPIRAHVC